MIMIVNLEDIEKNKYRHMPLDKLNHIDCDKLDCFDKNCVQDNLLDYWRKYFGNTPYGLFEKALGFGLGDCSELDIMPYFNSRIAVKCVLLPRVNNRYKFVLYFDASYCQIYCFLGDSCVAAYCCDCLEDFDILAVEFKKEVNFIKPVKYEQMKLW